MCQHLFETRFNAQKINFSHMNQNKHFFSNKMLFTDFKVKHTFCHQNRCDEWFWIQQNKILYTLCTYALLQLKIKRLHPKNNSRYCHLRGDIFFPRVTTWLIIYGLWWWEIFKNIGDKWPLNWRLKWVTLTCEDVYCFNRKHADNCRLHADKELQT